MALKSVEELQSTTVNLTIDRNTYSRKFLVIYTDTVTAYDSDLAVTASTEVGIPAIGDTHPAASEIVTGINVTNYNGEPNMFVVDVSYSFPDVTISDVTVAPWLRGNIYQVSNLPTSKLATINYIDDNTGKAIANAVGDPLRTEEIQLPQIQIVANVAETSLDLATIKASIGKINSDAFSFPSFPGGSGTYAVNTVLFQNFSSQEQEYQGTSYWQSAYTFLVRDDEFVEKYRNRGPNYYSTASTPASKKPITDNGRKVEGDLNTNGTLITTVSGGKIVIDSSTPNYIDVRYYKTAVLGTLI